MAAVPYIISIIFHHREFNILGVVFSVSIVITGNPSRTIKHLVVTYNQSQIQNGTWTEIGATGAAATGQDLKPEALSWLRDQFLLCSSHCLRLPFFTQEQKQQLSPLSDTANVEAQVS